MKTLQEIEPRTPISSAPFSITNPGSYYLTTGLFVTNGNAIAVQTNDVTLDLNGYPIRSASANTSGRGVFLGSGVRNVTIRNGFIGGGFKDGISYGYPTPDPGSENDSPPLNARVMGVSVTGCLNCGINLGDSGQDPGLAESCMVQTVGAKGIVAAIVRNCSALQCGDTGIQGVHVSDSRGETGGSGAGIQAITVQNCSGTAAGGGSGIFASTALNCSGNNSGSGRGVYASHTAQNCSGFSSSGTGVYARTAMNCSGNNGGIGAGIGVLAEGTAMSCYGTSVEGIGLVASNACFCTGSRLGGRAIEAIIGTGCLAIEGTNKITFKYNMP